MSITFAKATKTQLKARIALDGPSGAGKTWSGLTLAKTLGERVCWIDTERRSASLYADNFEFDTFTFDPPYDPSRLVDVLRAAEQQGYDVIGIDSLSHFWEGDGGTLDIVDRAAQNSFGGNKYMGWAVGTPTLRRLVDTMLSIDAHLIVAMRSKMDYVEEEDARGRKRYVKVGMAPVMRGGIEYEFTLVGDLDLEHRLSVTKSRCDAVADKVYPAGAAGDLGREFKSWLETGEPVITRDQVEKLRSVLNSIEADNPDSEDRKVAKRTWKDAHGDPVALLAKDFDAALKFAEELAGGAVGAAPPVEGSKPDMVAERLREYHAALDDLPEDARGACIADLAKSFPSVEQMDKEQILGATKIARLWPREIAPAKAEAEPKKRAKRSPAVHGVVAFAKGRGIDEAHLGALVGFLHGGAPESTDDLLESEIPSMELLIADFEAKRLTFCETDGVLGVVEEQKAIA